MAEEESSVDTVFCTAIDIESAEERREYVAGACGQDAQLRHQVDRLLRAHYGAGCFLESPPKGVGGFPTLAPPVTEKPGTQIGPYKLLQQLGEGGMGVVYMAEQAEPVERRVALKIIKPGMDTRQVIARFEAERQALAMMDHPYIAKVLDAGATGSGRPYFVMELVKGVAGDRVLRRTAPDAQGAIGAVRFHLPSCAARASEGHHPSGPQAQQYPGCSLRRTCDSQDY